MSTASVERVLAPLSSIREVKPGSFVFERLRSRFPIFDALTFPVDAQSLETSLRRALAELA